MNFDKLPLDDLKAARLASRNICAEHLASWRQSYVDGCVSDVDWRGWDMMGNLYMYLLDEFYSSMQGHNLLRPDMRPRLFDEERDMEMRKKSLVVALKMPSQGF